jgi:hypothetical protein
MDKRKSAKLLDTQRNNWISLLQKFRRPLEILWWCLHFKSFYDMVKYNNFKSKLMFKTYLVILVVSVQSCLKDENISLKKIENNSNKIRLDGYFLTSDNFGYSPYFLYQNGVIFSWTFISSMDTLNYENQFSDKMLIEKIKWWKYSWGVYQIINNEILIERWYPGERPYDVFLTKGKILNDTTFILTEFSEPDGSKKETINETYRFKKFSPKPDSTNMFIK